MNQLSQILVRTFARQANRSLNPGIKRRLKQETSTELTSDTLEEAESDFFQVHKTHRQFGNETEDYKEKIKSLIVRNKYFNVKFPNLLTWCEKEQIRYLHNSDKEEWSVARLADSFPADEFTIKKIIKSKWSPADQTRVARHDELVKKNWELLKEGQLDLELDLLEHLRKFSNRQLNELPNCSAPATTNVDLFQPASTEFASIVQSSRNTKKSVKPTKMLTSKVDEMNWKAPKKDMFVMSSGGENSRPVTYRQLGLPDITEHTEMSTANDGSRGDNLFGKLPNNVGDKNEMVKIEEVDLIPLCQPAIREHIRIPKKYWKRGATYKIDDCYYDYDGEFLYRVPGMK